MSRKSYSYRRTATKPKGISPQPGPQQTFLSSSANIAIFGGAAGGGKSFALLLDPLRHFTNPEFGAVIFRRTTRQVRNEGGIWDEALKLYAPLGAEPKIGSLEFVFKSGMRVQFAHLEHDKNVYDWQGSQLAFLGFDELTHFTEKQFWYMLSRNRSMSGVPGYVRATCNADSDSWVRRVIDWWIGEDGYPIPARSGVLRYFIRLNDEIHWADTPEELTQQFGASELPKSLTFIPAKLEDNPILMKKDPGYAANLNALSYVDRMRLKEGNWNVKNMAGSFFRKEWFEVVEEIPRGTKSVRYWDRASTEVSTKNADPDWTAGVKLTRAPSGIFYVEDVVRLRGSPHKVEQAILNTAKQDGLGVKIILEQDPGQAGVVETKLYAKVLAGFEIRFKRPVSDKQTRAKGASAQAEAGNVKLKAGIWNEPFLIELSGFPEAKHDDQVDGLSGALNAILEDGVGVFTSEMAEQTTPSLLEQYESAGADIDW